MSQSFNRPVECLLSRCQMRFIMSNSRKELEHSTIPPTSENPFSFKIDHHRFNPSSQYVRTETKRIFTIEFMGTLFGMRAAQIIPTIFQLQHIIIKTICHTSYSTRTMFSQHTNIISCLVRCPDPSELSSPSIVCQYWHGARRSVCDTVIKFSPIKRFKHYDGFAYNFWSSCYLYLFLVAKVLNISTVEQEVSNTMRDVNREVQREEERSGHCIVMVAWQERPAQASHYSYCQLDKWCVATLH